MEYNRTEWKTQKGAKKRDGTSWLFRAFWWLDHPRAKNLIVGRGTEEMQSKYGDHWWVYEYCGTHRRQVAGPFPSLKNAKLHVEWILERVHLSDAR
jgi:hypothetical protein